MHAPAAQHPGPPRAQVPWHQLLTSQLDEVTKLVGATVSCSGVKLNVSHPTYFQPHVQVRAAGGGLRSVGQQARLNAAERRAGPGPVLRPPCGGLPPPTAVPLRRAT